MTTSTLPPYLSNTSITSSLTLPSSYNSGSLITGSITSARHSPLEVRGDISVTNGDVVVDGVSIKKLLEGVADRMHILIPDPTKLEKYESLKRAYEQYKLLEKLCYEDTKT